MAIASSPEALEPPRAGPSTIRPLKSSGDGSEPFDVIVAYQEAIEQQYSPPLAAIMALVGLMTSSTTETTTGLARELKSARQQLIDTQSPLGVRAGCQLMERFFADATMPAGEEFQDWKDNLINQGKRFCDVEAEIARDRIADLAVGFLRDDCTILTHSYSRTVMKTLKKAHNQNKRIKVYVTEAKPNCLGIRTYDELTAAGIPCTVVLDSAVAYVMERVDMVLVGSEAVVESGGLVSAVGTYQMGLVAKALSKPFYALAESYKFLRHYPLSQTDLPLPRRSTEQSQPHRHYIPLTFPSSLSPHRAHLHPNDNSAAAAEKVGIVGGTTKKRGEGLTKEMLDLNPMVDITTPDLIDFIITDLGAPLSPTSISQYLVAQFSS